MKRPLTLRVSGLNQINALLGAHPYSERHHDAELAAADLEAAQADLKARTDEAEAARSLADQARAHANELRAELAEVKSRDATARDDVAAGRVTVEEAAAARERLLVIEQTLPLYEADATRLRNAERDADYAQREADERVRLIEAARAFQKLREKAEVLAPELARYCELAWCDGLLLRPAPEEVEGGDE